MIHATQRHSAPAVTPGLTARDFWALLDLISKPEEARKLLLDIRDAEKTTRAALAELAEADGKLSTREAAVAANEMDHAEWEERLVESRRKLEGEMEELRERISRQQVREAEVARERAALESRELAIAAGEAELAKRLAAIDGAYQAVKSFKG